MSSKLESDVRYRVAPSGKKLRRKAQDLRKVIAAYRQVYGLVTCGLTAGTPGSAPGQRSENEQWENFTVFIIQSAAINLWYTSTKTSQLK